MKKNIIIIIAILLISNLTFSQEETKLYPKINKVTVFSSSAQVEKSIPLTLKQGFNEIILCGNSPYLRRQSIQFNNSSDFIITEFTPYIQTVRKDITAEEKLDAKNKQLLSNLKDSLKKLDKEHYDIDIVYNVYYKELEVLQELQNVYQTDSLLEVKKMKNVLPFYRNKSIELKSLIAKYEKESLKLDKKRKEIETNIQLILQGDEEAKENNINEYYIKLTLYAQKEIQTSLQYMYSVGGIKWNPFYDLKFDKSSNESQFILKTEFQQNTSEDWEDVKLVFSTQNSEEQGEPYDLQPMVYSLYSSNYIPKSNGILVGKIVDAKTNEPMPFVNIIVMQNGVQKGGAQTDMDGNYQIKPLAAGYYDVEARFVGYKKSIKTGVRVSSSGYSAGGNISLEPSSQQLDEVVISAYAIPLLESQEDDEYYDEEVSESDFAFVDDAKTISSFEEESSSQNSIAVSLAKEYEVEMNYTIKSGEKAKIIPLEEKKANSFFKYFAVPKKEKIVYLSSLVPAWEDMDLINAKAKIYIDESYVNDSYISINQTSDTLSIPIGKDKRVVIDRKVSFTQPKKFNRKGSILETTVTIDITAKNNKDQAVNLRIDDQVPVSNIEEISIEKNEISGAVIDEKTGLLYWDLNLNASESKAFTIKYTIRYPKTTNIAFD
ncbi:MAG TPA: hypothetical protein DD434_09965 [Bacteroidales bacterium]|nr:hypothetical protein [Bacteroidales bacterium]